MKKLFLLSLAPICLFAGQWADTTLASLSLEEKIGQLFVVSACPTRGEDHWADWDHLINGCHVGGVLIKSGTAKALKETIQKLQERSPIPLLVAADAEWGLGMTSPSFLSFPRNMTLGAVKDLSLIEEVGYQVGLQCQSVGVHLNLAPVADVNNNPKNPIIHMRSFGEDPTEVGEKAEAYAKGLNKAGVLACAKHFPGHGDTTVDSHHSLPTIAWNRERLDAIELNPFKYLSEKGIDAVMTAHLLVPALDSELPSSLSKLSVDGVLRKDLGFEGLVITDALNMKGVADYYSTAEIAKKAHGAGNDLLLYGSHIGERVDDITRVLVPTAYSALLELYRSGERPIEELDKTVLRILQAKEKVSQSTIEFDPEEASILKAKLFEAAATVVGDLALEDPIGYVGVGKPETDLLAAHFGSSQDLDLCNTVVIGLHDVMQRADRYNVSPEIEKMIKDLSGKTNVIVCLFGTPYAIRYFEGQKAVIIGYEDDAAAQTAVLEILKGEIEPKGKLPIELPH